jgi:hypothetical protein
MGINGHIRYPNSALPVSLADVYLQGPTPVMTPSDGTGQYGFTDLASANWQIVPARSFDTNDRNRITTGDAVAALQAGITGNLNQAQLLACDADGNGSVTSLDAVFILQYVIGSISSLPVAQKCGSGWAFMPTAAPSGQQLTQPQVSTCQPGAIAFQPLATQQNGQDFSAVLFGDCNLSWQPSPTGAAALSASAKSASPVAIGRARRRGNHVRVPLLVNTGTFQGLDVRLQYDSTQLAVHRIYPVGGARGALFVTNQRVPGQLAIALASAEPLHGGTVFVLDFATRSRRLVTPAITISQATTE